MWPTRADPEIEYLVQTHTKIHHRVDQVLGGWGGGDPAFGRIRRHESSSSYHTAWSNRPYTVWHTVMKTSVGRKRQAESILYFEIRSIKHNRLSLPVQFDMTRYARMR